MAVKGGVASLNRIYMGPTKGYIDFNQTKQQELTGLLVTKAPQDVPQGTTEDRRRDSNNANQSPRAPPKKGQG
jgi:hypothetical protein